MIVTVGNTKGGVGKTTLALQLALARADAGRDVLMVDGDRQGSTQMAVAVRADAGRMPGLACVQYHDGAVLRVQVQRQASKYDDVVIDAGGRDSSALRAALYISDLLIVPFQPRSVDVWALADIATLVDEANGIREGLRAYAVLNAADPGTSSDNIEAAAALGDFPQLALLDIPIRRRKAFANADEMTINRGATLRKGNQDVDAFISKAPDARKGVIRGRKEQITLTIAPDLLAKVDEIATRMGQSRAALINRAIYELAERIVSQTGTSDGRL